MYSICVLFQLLSIIVLFVISCFIFTNWSAKSHSFIFLCIIAILLNSIGYFIEITSKSLEMMAMGTKIAYIGRPFITLGMLFFTADFCRIKIKHIYKFILFGCSSLITFSVLFCEKIPFFYSSYKLMQTGWFPHIVYEHGWLYYVYMFSNILFFGVICFFTMKRMGQHITKVEKEQLLYIFLMSSTAILGLAIYLSNCCGGYDTTQVAYLIDIIIFLISFYRCNIMGEIEIIKDNVVDNLDEGVIAYNYDDDVIYYNELAGKLFPELLENAKKIYNLTPNPIEEEFLFIDDYVYKPVIHHVKKGKKKLSKMVVISDITTSYRYTMNLEDQVYQKTNDINKMQSAVIVGIADFVEARDGFTGEHIKNTQFYVKQIVDELKNLPDFCDDINEEYAKQIIEAAPLHDIGKISVPDNILGKQGRLTGDEFEIIKKHSEDGAKIIKKTLANLEDENYLATAYNIAMFHHEKWDGSGYPTGLKGEEIPLCARIMAVADVYDALRCKRSYKESMTHEEAKRILIEGKDKHFDGRIVDIFIKAIEQ